MTDAPALGQLVRRASVLRLSATGDEAREDDLLAVEEPLEIRIGGVAQTVTMRTPGHDEELARGFLFGEGLVRAAGDIARVERPPPRRPEENGNVVDIFLAERLAQLGRPSVQRNFYASSSCGVCGKSSLAAIEVHARPVAGALVIERGVVARLPSQLRAAQAAFELTGGLHAAALFDAGGAIVAVREDVGRHNAVDKLVGWALVAGHIPTERCALGLLVSGRTSFEILQKAAMARLPIVCAVSAPSSLAVALAERLGITLVGFLRQGSMNVYTHPHRIAI